MPENRRILAGLLLKGIFVKVTIGAPQPGEFG